MGTRWLSAAVALAALESVAGGAQGATAYQNGLVAYTRCCGPAGIFTIRADGSGAKRMANVPSGQYDIAWSPTAAGS